MSLAESATHFSIGLDATRDDRHEASNTMRGECMVPTDAVEFLSFLGGENMGFENGRRWL